MAEPNARRLLAALAGSGAMEPTQPAGPDEPYRVVIDAAIEATTDFESAASFLDERDLTELERAVERAETDLSARATGGADALDALRRLAAAANGECQFRSGRSSPLGGDDVAGTR